MLSALLNAHIKKSVIFFPGLLDHVTVLIGVAVNGIAQGGVINQPYFNYKAGPDAKLGRCIWGLVGLGKHNLFISSSLRTHYKANPHSRRMMSCLLALGGCRRVWSAGFSLMATSSASAQRSLGRTVVHVLVFGVPFHIGRGVLLPA